MNTDNFGFTKANEGIITTSWNSREEVSLADDEVIFSLLVKAKTSTELNKVLTITSQYTKAEAYTSDMELMDVALTFKTDNNVEIDQTFTLYQNQPNPFKEETMIGFTLPEASKATLTIYDVAGRTLKMIRNDFAKGYNTVSINRSDLGSTGLLYYRLETKNDIATKKMIVID